MNIYLICHNLVIVQVAKYEEKDPNLPHWMRREIGSILEKASDVKKLGMLPSHTIICTWFILNCTYI